MSTVSTVASHPQALAGAVTFIVTAANYVAPFIPPQYQPIALALIGLWHAGFGIMAAVNASKAAVPVSPAPTK